jgi:hypothetical protein
MWTSTASLLSPGQPNARFTAQGVMVSIKIHDLKLCGADVSKCFQQDMVIFQQSLAILGL